VAQGEWEGSKRLINAAIGILQAEHPMTVRQAF
jgi:hypothetical protein